MDDQLSAANRQVIVELVRIGGAEGAVVPAPLAEKARDHILSGLVLRDVLDSLTLVELENLIRGMVLVSRSAGYHHGSASPIIELYRKFIARAPEREPALTAWIVDNRINDYEPFGTGIANTARSQRERAELLRQLAADRERRLGAERARQVEAAEQRAEMATLRLPNAVRRGDVAAVAALLDRGASPAVLTPEGLSMQQLARREGNARVEALLRDWEPLEGLEVRDHSRHDTERLRHLFHSAWGQAKESREYQKEVWGDLVAELSKHGLEL